MDAAEASIKEIVASHPEALTDLIERLSTAWQEAALDFSDEKIAGCFNVVHDLSGLGTTLGMPLVSTWSRSLCRFLELSYKARESTRDVIEAHIAAIRLVITHSAAAANDDVRRRIEAELQTATAKFHRRFSASAEGGTHEKP